LGRDGWELQELKNIEAEYRSDYRLGSFQKLLDNESRIFRYRVFYLWYFNGEWMVTDFNWRPYSHELSWKVIRSHLEKRTWRVFREPELSMEQQGGVEVIMLRNVLPK
jgi:hypothetical protein